MTLDLWLTFSGASLALCLLPGPTIMMIVGYALSGGKRTGLWTLPGVAAGDVVAITLSLAGLGAVMATSALAFTVLKWIGVLYLVWLGIKLWRAPVNFDELPAETSADSGQGGNSGKAHGRGWPMAVHAFTVTALNPKGIAFFVAFLPQFVVPSAPVLPQLVLLGTTFSVIALVVCAGYVLLAGQVGQAIRTPGLRRAVNKVGGGCMIGAGAMTALVSRAN